MRLFPPLATTCAAAVLLMAAGCGSSEGGSEAGGPQVPVAAVNGPKAEQPPASAQAAGPALSAPRPDSLHPVVVIKTSMGDVTVQLDAQRADCTVDNFLSYVERKHYDGTIFHQVFRNYVILGGGYTPEYVEKPAGAEIYNQANNGLRNLRGTIAMARDPRIIDSATCQFFINVADNPHLDHQSPDSAETYGYCVFGKVIDGMEVVDAISRVPVRDTEQFECTPVEPVVIHSIRRVR
ncbi:MAG TPA: peptidyl-prolyl cis-trans isomerase [Planctomycetaceae bacterium]|nr:peptidyl-prolyl cis-trans isomerase [Planctomycetaceae bacterium]HIQ19720.1 peptidyl-prolyl cis-trans isomerase [Planctomycetota bacterium]